MNNYTHDLFLSFSFNDLKVARELAKALELEGVKVWISNKELRNQVSRLAEDINNGIKNSKDGLILLSPSYIRRRAWTMRELEALIAKETDGGMRIIVVWHNMKYEDVLKEFPLLAGYLARQTSEGIPRISRHIAKVLQYQVPSPKFPRIDRWIQLQETFYQWRKAVIALVTVTILLCISSFWLGFPPLQSWEPDPMKSKSLDTFPIDSIHQNPSARRAKRLKEFQKKVQALTQIDSVKAGSRIELSAKGNISPGPFFQDTMTPDGKNVFITKVLGITMRLPDSYDLVPNLPHGMLLYRLESDDQWRGAGSSHSFEAVKDGFLELTINDLYPGDNSGFFEVQVSIEAP